MKRVSRSPLRNEIDRGPRRFIQPKAGQAIDPIGSLHGPWGSQKCIAAGSHSWPSRQNHPKFKMVTMETCFLLNFTITLLQKVILPYVIYHLKGNKISYKMMPRLIDFMHVKTRILRENSDFLAFLRKK